jgi:glutamate N-acetyltransferase/amino-acid N-acetyltransferase
MAVNLPALLPLHPITGIKIGTTCAQIKYLERDDLTLIELSPHSTCAAVFTRNAFCAAPVLLAKQHLAATTPRYLLINAGNANAGTGEPGLRNAHASCEAVAQLTGCAVNEILPFSTGVIGAQLPVAKMQAAIPNALANLNAQGWEQAAHAIMTTDTGPKGESIQSVIDGHPVTVTGIVKGAGMIKPDMATLLVFIATDATVETSVLQQCLTQAMEESFHRITIDGDTSTNDACVLMATGHSSLPPITNNRDCASLGQLITQVCRQLAQKVVRDAEGATKFITIDVEQGRSKQECLDVAYTIAHSPLVKTAFFASDANWGRILAAVGRSGITNLEINTIKIYLGDVCIVENGGVAESYTEEQGQDIMSKAEISVRVLLGRTEANENGHKVRIWTSDLSHDYIRINAEYRT